MDLGATVCTRARAALRRVSGRGAIASRAATDRIAELPSPRPRKALPQRAVRVLVLERAGAILLEKRPAAGIWGGLWSLPEIDARRRRRARIASARFGARRRRPATSCRRSSTASRTIALTMHPQRVAVRAWPPRAEAPGLPVAHARRRARRRAAGADPEAASLALIADRRVVPARRRPCVCVAHGDSAGFRVAERAARYRAGCQSRRSGGSSCS